MGLYSLVLLAAIAFLTYVGSASNVTAANSPTQAGRSVKKQTGTSTERFLRADVAVDEDNEAVDEGNEARMVDVDSFIGKVGRLSSKALRPFGVGNGARNTKADGELTAPLLEDHRIIADKPLRAEDYHSISPKHLDEAPKELSSEKELSQVLNLVNNKDPSLLDAQLTEWQNSGKSIDDVLDLLKMIDDGYASFNMDKYAVLKKYLAKVSDETTNTKKSKNHKATPPTLAKLLKKISGKDLVPHTMLIGKLTALEKDNWLKAELNRLLFRWTRKPAKLETTLKDAYPKDDKVVSFIAKEYKEYKSWLFNEPQALGASDNSRRRY